MKDSIRRIQQDGFSEPLLELVKRWRIQKWSVECIKTCKAHALLTLVKRKDLCWFHEGIAKKTSSVLLEASRNRVIEVDTASHTLIRVNGEEVKGIKKNEVLNLNDDGERWEGDVLNNQPYGWGVLYDSENRMVYEGFRIGDVNVCYGTQYYSDIGVIEYAGEWFEGKRWGRGVQYDRTGNTMFDGEWLNDENKMETRVEIASEDFSLHSLLEELIVKNYNGNGLEWSELDLTFMPNLRLLEVGDECFYGVEEVKLIGLDQLERVVIGQRCFTRCRLGRAHNDSSRHFYLKNCKRLRELTIGKWSFSDYSVCEIENLPSLEGIKMGELQRESGMFWYASLELKSDSQSMK